MLVTKLKYRSDSVYKLTGHYSHNMINPVRGIPSHANIQMLHSYELPIKMASLMGCADYVINSIQRIIDT